MYLNLPEYGNENLQISVQHLVWAEKAAIHIVIQ